MLLYRFWIGGARQRIIGLDIVVKGGQNMTIAAIQPIPSLKKLPKTLPIDNAVRLELFDGVPSVRAASTVQERIELLEKQRESQLTKLESQELDLYEEVDDYLSFVNRAVRNLLLPQPTRRPKYGVTTPHF